MQSESLVRTRSAWQGWARFPALCRRPTGRATLSSVAVLQAMVMGVGVFGAEPVWAIAQGPLPAWAQARFPQRHHPR